MDTNKDTNEAQKLVWVDTDIAIGSKTGFLHYCDVDDGYAIAALFRAQEVDVVGISSTLGNVSDIAISTRIAREFVSSYGPNSAPVYQGASAPLSGKDGSGEGKTASETNEAVEQLAALLKENRLTILCIGAATNIALLLMHHPELAGQIDEIVLVAGRRSIDQHFISGHWQPKPFRDLNFEADPEAYIRLLESSVPLTLVPYEACREMTITPHDLHRLEKANKVGRFLSEHSLGWITEWETVFGLNGFNPFDLVAAGYLIRPDLFTVKHYSAGIESAPDDTDHHHKKTYLVCNDTIRGYRQVKYCTDVDPACKEYLLGRICTHDMAAFVLGQSHLNIIVDNVDEAETFYRQVLGFEQAYDADGNKMDYQGVEMRAFALDAGLMDGKVKVDVRFLRHPQAGIFLELMVYHEPVGTHVLPPQPKTYDFGGPRHIALEVSNCAEVFAYLDGMEGVTMINTSRDYHPVKLDGFPITFFYWIDKYGIQWEMEEGRRIGSARGIA